ncbi:Putative kinase-like protein TMKL1 [Linum perenne]
MAVLKLYPLMLFCISLTAAMAAALTQHPALSTTDVELLLGKIKPLLQGNNENLLLTSWNSSVPLCQWRGLQWVHSNGSEVSCSNTSAPQWSSLSLYKDPSLHISSLQLPSANLSGSLPRELGEFSMLRSLFLNFNSLSGTIPLELGYSSSLSDIDLSGNLLSGSLAPSIWNLCDKLATIRVHGNSLSGPLPDPALPNSTCENVRVVDLGGNRFSGKFPEFVVTRFLGLKELDLSSNAFEGSIPQGLSGLVSLEKLNLSHNNFSGVLPVFKSSSKFGVEAFEGNSPTLCGSPLRSCTRTSGLSSGMIAGIVIGLMAGVVVLASLLIGYVQNKKRKGRGESEDEVEEWEDEESGANGVGNGGGGGGGGGEGKLVLFQGGEHLVLEDVLNATGQVMEKTSYGTIYKAKLADGSTIALRLLREGSCKDGGSCSVVVKQLGRIRHENLIPLRAFYQGKRGEKLLIYDYLPHRSLHDLLHVGKPMLNWVKRHKIALGIARGLAYLHTGLEPPITHGNIRSKNVLVDDFAVARLTEFGLDRLMVPNVADEIVAQAKTDGYKAPELQRMKKCNSRTDVYAFGILLLEILIGKKPGKSSNKSSSDFVDLPSTVKVAVLEETTMEVFDIDVVKGLRNPLEEGLLQALKLAMGCCAPVPSVRPTMDEVVKQLEENRPRNRSALYSPAESRSGLATPF